jgi:hypothetical protein
MNDETDTAVRGNRLTRFLRLAWLVGWVGAGVLLLVGGTDTSETYFLMWPVWLALAPWLWPRLSFIGRGIFYGYSVMLCGMYVADLDFEFSAFDREEYFHALLFGSLAGLVIAVSRHGLGPDSPASERIVRTAFMTLALITLLLSWLHVSLPSVR